MFSKFKNAFGRGKAEAAKTSKAKAQADDQDNQIDLPATSAQSQSQPQSELEQPLDELQHARELNLAFISSLLGTRAVATEESKAQESKLRVILDAEMVGITDKSIPKLSPSALSLMQDLMSADVDQNKIASAVSEDPGLAGKVLSMANSPVFTASDINISDIPHAVAMLGHAKLRQVVMNSLMADQFELKASYFKDFGVGLWEHSAEVAINAGKLAADNGGDAGRAYFAGLIHDIGKLIIFKKLVQLHQQDNQQPHPQVFGHLLNDYSQALTRRACEVWELPEYWYSAVMEWQMGELEDLESPESIALFFANYFSELHTLFVAGEITQFELIWRLQEIGSSVEQFEGLYPETLAN